MTETRDAMTATRLDRLRGGLKRRYAREARFRLYGILAIAVAVAFLALLLGRIIDQGHTAFYAHEVSVPVYLDPAEIDPAYPQGTNFEQMVAQQQLASRGLEGDAAGPLAAEMRGLFSSELKFEIARRVAEDPSLIGQTVTFDVPVSDEADLYFKDEISIETPPEQRRLTNQQIGWLDELEDDGSRRTSTAGCSPVATRPSPNWPGCWARSSARR